MRVWKTLKSCLAWKREGRSRRWSQSTCYNNAVHVASLRYWCGHVKLIQSRRCLPWPPKLQQSLIGHHFVMPSYNENIIFTWTYAGRCTLPNKIIWNYVVMVSDVSLNVLLQIYQKFFFLASFDILKLILCVCFKIFNYFLISLLKSITIHFP